MFGGQRNSTAPGLLKFEPPKDPIELENAKKAWEMPHLEKISYLERKFREKQHMIDNDRMLRAEDKLAIKSAMQIFLQQMQLQAWDSEADECYLKEFRDFLQGKSKYNQDGKYKHLVPWGKHALVGKDIDAYIDAVLDKKIEFDAKIAKMFRSKMAPRTLQDAWLYYVFICTGKKPPTDLFLKSWDAFYPFDNDNSTRDTPMRDWVKHPEDAQPREDQKGITGPKESCDHTATAQAVTDDTKPHPAHPMQPVEVDHPIADPMEEDVQPEVPGEAVPPLTSQVPEGQAIETEQEDKEPPPAPQTIKITHNNYQALPPEEFVQRYFAVQDDRFAHMVQEFKISNQEQTKALLQGLEGIVQGMLTQATTPQTAPTNPELTNYLKAMELRISQQLSEGFKTFADSNLHLSRAIYDSCSISKNLYDQDKQDPNAGALLEAVTAQSKQMAQIQQNLLQVQAQQGDRLNTLITSLQGKIEANDAKLAQVVENYAQLANAEATTKYQGLLKLADFTVAALQQDKQQLQQQVVAQNAMTGQLQQQISQIQQATSSQMESLLKGDRGTQLKIEELGKALTDAANKIGAPQPPQIVFVQPPVEESKDVKTKVEFIEEGVEVKMPDFRPAPPKQIEGSPHPPALTYQADQELIQKALQEYKAYEEAFSKKPRPALVDIETKIHNINEAQSEALALLDETKRRALIYKKFAKQERKYKGTFDLLESKKDIKSKSDKSNRENTSWLNRFSKDELDKITRKVGKRMTAEKDKKTRESVLKQTKIEEID
jgi:hypothetical protein